MLAVPSAHTQTVLEGNIYCLLCLECLAARRFFLLLFMLLQEEGALEVEQREEEEETNCKVSIFSLFLFFLTLTDSLT